MEAFKDRLRFLRENKKITQKELAKLINVAESTVSMYERGEREPSFEIAVRLANLFNVSIDYLLGRTDDPTPPQQPSTSRTNIPSWATKKDIRDFKRMLEEDAPVMFDGVPLDDEDREKVLKVMEAIFWDAKKRNKRKPVEE